MIPDEGGDASATIVPENLLIDEPMRVHARLARHRAQQMQVEPPARIGEARQVDCRRVVAFAVGWALDEELLARPHHRARARRRDRRVDGGAVVGRCGICQTIAPGAVIHDVEGVGGLVALRARALAAGGRDQPLRQILPGRAVARRRVGRHGQRPATEGEQREHEEAKPHDADHVMFQNEQPVAVPTAMFVTA